MATKIERTIHVWHSHGQTWGWEVTTWRKQQWLTKTSGTADSQAAARQTAFEYHHQYPLRAPVVDGRNWNN